MNNEKTFAMKLHANALEVLYRENPEAFKKWLNRALQKSPRSETLIVWSARLTFERPDHIH